MKPAFAYRSLRLLFPFLLLSLAAPAALADEVVLTNGDRLTGTVLNKTPEGLVLQTSYAGRVKIDWRMVETLKTDQPVTVLMRRDEGSLETRLEPSDPGTVKLTEAPEVPPLKLDRIAYLNPTPSQSGEGTEYKGRLNVAGSANSGNSDTRQVIAEAQLEGVAKESRFMTRLRGEQRNEGGNDTANNWLASGDKDWFIDKRRFVYGRTSFERDHFRDLRGRYALGAGYGLQLVETDDTNLSVKGGLDYVRELRYEDESQAYPAFGWGIRYRHWLIGRSAEFFHEQDGYMNTEDTKDVTLRTRTGLRLPIVDRLSAQVQALLDWEGKPADDRKATDISLQVGLGYEW
ncbi:DUF481 domain-containing protein [Azoarcus indigens]|uniref:Putative salt-induced outer membrane protein YdiY n=1 Tax=Azoarcus indigens TaxID=29545 RepID=A0A4R6EH50_9RHOO|nr:DUF481 domain-containing protein [Azoarcus indigens]NMG65353.1 DUF481 domain-containing protein [Azoarcus indigens]TDN56737.1 putative salt-induced outer membrane protein YdiY [Azoarcus indigens]